MFDMALTLKQSHELELKKKLLEFRSNPELLSEAIDSRELMQLRKTISTLKKLFEQPEFNGLTSFKEGLAEANSDIVNFLNSNSFKKFFNTDTKKIALFTKCVLNLLKQLPDIATFAKDAANIPNFNPDMSISAQLINQTQDSDVSDDIVNGFDKMIIKSLKPSFFKSVPYIDIERAVEEISNLSFNTIRQLSRLSRGSREIEAAAPAIVQDAFSSALRQLRSEPGPQQQQQQKTTPSIEDDLDLDLDIDDEVQKKKAAIAKALGKDVKPVVSADAFFREARSTFIEEYNKSFAAVRATKLSQTDKSMEAFTNTISKLMKSLIDSGVMKPSNK